MSAVKMHVKKGDKVMIIAGKDKGKTGRISRILPDKGAVLVEGLNIIKRHSRPNKQKNTGGGIVEKEAPLAASNVMILCKSCNQAVRVGYQLLEDGKKVRFCKKCKETLEG
jgi:large subunit ribosomal protein L24